MKNCWDAGDYTSAEFRHELEGGLQVGDDFQVSFLYNGFPISATYEMSIRIDRNGCALLVPSGELRAPEGVDYCD